MKILSHIAGTWPSLTRTHKDYAKAAVDPKTPGARPPWPVFVAADEDPAAIAGHLRREMKPEDFEQITVERLPEKPGHMERDGLLYLPRPYVVPGGRFNEMYGWDSFFIQMGLLRDGYGDLAEDLAEDFLYEIRHYGKVLNANRSYYLTRSHPPFLTEMLLEVFRRRKDIRWLSDSLDAVYKYYAYWTEGPHLTETGLSRYYDAGEGPAAEVLSSELDSVGRTDYDLIREYFRTHDITDYDASRFYDAAKDELTPQFFKGDRAMRESGCDPSNRFGPFSADILHYNPVCLNTLLYRMEMQTVGITEKVGRAKETQVWLQRARARVERINSLLWDQEQGLYLDYNFVEERRRFYPFLTTFYPLWAGIASVEQARGVARNLPLFECQCGLQTSPNQSGDQWDGPIGWAPFHWFAVEGLRRYGFEAEAERISRKFLTLVEREFDTKKTLEEKYDVVACTANIGDEILYGYRSNEAGFGWTNAVFTAFYDQLQRKSARSRTGISAAATHLEC